MRSLQISQLRTYCTTIAICGSSSNAREFTPLPVSIPRPPHSWAVPESGGKIYVQFILIQFSIRDQGCTKRNPRSVPAIAIPITSFDLLITGPPINLAGGSKRVIKMSLRITVSFSKEIFIVADIESTESEQRLPSVSTVNSY